MEKKTELNIKHGYRIFVMTGTMKKLEVLGSLFVIVGSSILAGYGMYMFIQSYEIPLIIRFGSVLFFTGILIILLSLVKERLIEKRRGLL